MMTQPFSYHKIHEELDSLIPSEVKEKLKNVKGDVEFCKILADNGIDVEKVEKKIKEAGFDLNKICLQEVSDNSLENVTGGFENFHLLVKCRCGNENRDDFSWQFFASKFHASASIYNLYRCKICNTYVKVYQDYYIYVDEDDVEYA